MPANKRPSKTKGGAGAPEGFTPQRFEKELKDLAAKAKEDTWGRHATDQVLVYVKSLVLLSLLGIYANVSQLALSPVYGSIPSSIYHSKILMVGCFVGWSGNLFLRQKLPLRTENLLPIVAIYIPFIQYFLYQFSDALGPKWGPAVTEGVTLFPLAALSAACVADYLEQAHLSMLPNFIAEAAPGIGSWGVFKLMESTVARHLGIYVGQAFIYTRLGMEILLGASYAIFSPSKFLFLVLPALFHTSFLNTHVQTSWSTAALNETMAAQNFTLLDRQESLTGYISVIESQEAGWRVLRCDHSLLGGDWVMVHGKRIPVKEPVYGVFLMLEAVRLVETEVAIADKDAQALNIGLGIGTTPTAFVEHGINTTVVEIDPVVHEFAVKYFGHKENNPPVLQDAVSYTAELAKAAPESYDYIVHDVFTGGAEPVDLFTLEFLQGLNALLKPEGVIAINYAGDFQLPAPRVVIRTILQIFPTCRIFREAAPDETRAKEDGQDFINTVIFCRKTEKPLTFRPAIEADYLGTQGRRAFLEPKHEVDVEELLAVDEEWGIMRKNETDKLTQWHVTSALGHWDIMRIVVPSKIWEMW
ncbi:S-adenosyl-L-methionine-dependent methyltransferase [Stachybotrys elegans]|uniref:S-adenosyl-L-methionine-dependent methyltransferase n=1 Tax=Stachybotrys elegans TaxID=80388 RepID=A0A8K0SQL8_9HYPO|nr:S-adenosyl-L-methionine-dependent methyltransferase [Stachybotrys elegans]